MVTRATLAARDAAKPPRWLPRALVLAAAVAALAILAWRAVGQLGNVILIVTISWFVSLAMEPSVRWLVTHGWRRTRATGLVMVTGLLGVVAIVVVFGGLFVSQLVDLVRSLPQYYADLASWADSTFDVTMPSSDDIVDTVAAHWQDLAPGVVGAGISLVNGFFTATSVLLVTYYMASRGPQFRAAVLRFFAPDRQVRVLQLWEVSQQKVGDFINSRLVLATLCTVFTWIFLALLHIPYSLALAAFTGIVSQFVPTIGTYIGGALPVAVALTISLGKGVAVLAFIIAYQQVENLIFSPRVSARSLEINPAVSFVGVIGFGAVFGPLGAFLALPVIATIQAVAWTYLRRHELVDSPLLSEDAQALRRQRAWTEVRDDETEPGAAGAQP
jgi:predicted PurR-regulated permease PerM